MNTPLKRLLEKKNLPYAALATQIGHSGAHIWNIANGEANASPAIAEKIALLFPGEISELELLYPERYAANTASPISFPSDYQN